VSFAYELPFHDSYLFGMVHLLPLNYLNLSHITITKINREVTDIHVRGIILGFASLFLLIKSYANWLTAELSQLCYDGRWSINCATMEF